MRGRPLSSKLSALRRCRSTTGWLKSLALFEDSWDLAHLSNLSSARTASMLEQSVSLWGCFEAYNMSQARSFRFQHLIFYDWGILRLIHIFTKFYLIWISTELWNWHSNQNWCSHAYNIPNSAINALSLSSFFLIFVPTMVIEIVMCQKKCEKLLWYTIKHDFESLQPFETQRAW